VFFYFPKMLKYYDFWAYCSKSYKRQTKKYENNAQKSRFKIKMAFKKKW
jgi:hypothetical protein